MTQVAYSPYAYKAPAPTSSPPCLSPPIDPKIPPRPDAALAPQIWKDTFQAPSTERLIADFHCNMLDYKNGVFEAHVFVSANYVAIKPLNPPQVPKKLQHFIISMGQIASWSRATKIPAEQPPYVKIKTVKPGQIADSIHIYGTDLRLHLLFDFAQMSYERFCYIFDNTWRASPGGAAAAAASLAASMRGSPYGLNLTATPGIPTAMSPAMGLSATGMFTGFGGRPMGMGLGMQTLSPMGFVPGPLGATAMPAFGTLGTPFAPNVTLRPFMSPSPMMTSGLLPVAPPCAPAPPPPQQQPCADYQQQAPLAPSPPPIRPTPIVPQTPQGPPPPPPSTQQQQQQPAEIVEEEAESTQSSTPVSVAEAINLEATSSPEGTSGFKVMHEATSAPSDGGKAATTAEDKALLEGCKVTTDWNEMPLTVTPDKLGFNLGSRQAAVDQELTEQVQVTNNSKDKAAFKFIPKQSTKYTLTADPAEGKVPAGKAMVVTLKMIVLCTTQLRLELPFVCWKGSKITDKTVKFMSHLTAEIESQLTTKLDIDELTLFTPPIGDGSFGTVYKGEYRGLEVAIKVLKAQGQITKQMMDDFDGEVGMMEKLRHPCIINFIGAVHTPGQLAMVTEFCPYGSLGSAITKEKFSYGLKLKALVDTARGMDFLHRSNILHRDLKPDNILMVSLEVRASVICKISDFGTTRDVNRFSSEMHYTKGVGTPIFMAPEILEGKSYEKSADVYSFAILMANVALDTLPFENDPEIKSSWQFATLVINGKRPKLPPNTAPDFAALIASCWVKAEKERPSFSDIVQKLEVMFKRELHCSKKSSN